MFGCMLSVTRFPANSSRCLSYLIFYSIFLLRLDLFTLVHEHLEDHWLVYGFKDLENTDYYCPDCKAKSNRESSALEKCQPKMKYVYTICVSSFLQFFFGQLHILLYRLTLEVIIKFKPNVAQFLKQVCRKWWTNCSAWEGNCGVQWDGRNIHSKTSFVSLELFINSR